MSEQTLLLVLSIATLIVAVIGTIYSLLAYRLKAGIQIRGSFSFMSSVAAEDRYVHEITLETLKDRAVVVFKIFVELSHGYYVLVEDFEHEPLILRPFEAFRRRYEPIDQYSVGLQRIAIDGLIQAGVRTRLVLATAQGRYNVSARLQRWDPISNFFNNHLTALIYPQKTTFEGKAYGSGTKYIVRFRAAGQPDEIVPIYPHDYQVKRFRSFQLTADALVSRDTLEEFLLGEATAGRIQCADLDVYDMEQWRHQVYREDAKEVVNALPRNWLAYHVGGWVITKWSNLRLWKQNRAHRRASQR